MTKKPTHEKHAPKSKENKQEELQHKYIELQILKQQISQYVEQKQALDEKQGEMNATIEALRKIDTIKEGDEMWSSLGSSTFVRSDIKDTKKVLVAIGAGVVTKKPVERAIEILESRVKDLDALSTQIVEQANALLERINELEPQVQKLMEQME